MVRRRIYTYGFKDEFAEEYFKSLESIAEILVETEISEMDLIELYDISERMINKEPNRVEVIIIGEISFYKKEYEKTMNATENTRNAKSHQHISYG